MGNPDLDCSLGSIGTLCFKFSLTLLLLLTQQHHPLLGNLRLLSIESLTLAPRGEVYQPEFSCPPIGLQLTAFKVMFPLTSSPSNKVLQQILHVLVPCHMGEQSRQFHLKEVLV